MKHTQSRSRRLKRGIAVTTAVLIILALSGILLGTYTVLKSTGVEMPAITSTALVKPYLLESVYCYKTTYDYGSGYSLYRVYINETVVTSEYMVFLIDTYDNSTVYYELHAKGEPFEFQLYTIKGDLVILIYNNMVDAIKIENVTGANNTVHVDPTPWLQYCVTKESYYDMLAKGLSAFFAGLSVIFTIAIPILGTLLPWSGSLFVLMFIHAIYKCIDECSIEPLFDYFYKLYKLVQSILAYLIQIIMKLIDLVTGPAT